MRVSKAPARFSRISTISSRLRRLLAVAPCVLALGAGATGCGSRDGDPHAADGVVPSPSGPDLTIRAVSDPDSETHQADGTTNVRVSGASVVAVDTYDETGKGDVGTVYVQDIGSRKPFSGIQLRTPTYTPGNLSVGEGDVLDFVGTYQETTSIPGVDFPPGSLLPQFFRPAASLRFEAPPIEPKDIDIQDLVDFKTARQWLGMLVRVKNVKLYRAVSADSLDSSGRLSVAMTEGTGGFNQPFPKPPKLTNELANVATLNLPSGTTVKSITGVVTFFAELHIAPRSIADIELN